MKKEKLDYDKITNIKVEGIDMKDYPDFCDAFISSADYECRPMIEEELDELNEDSYFVYEAVMNQLF
jgi:hypothetical protein